MVSWANKETHLSLFDGGCANEKSSEEEEVVAIFRDDHRFKVVQVLELEVN